jgi:oligosaccharide repeat unit polymerase
MDMPPLLLASMGLVGVIGGRLLFGRWFNHLSLYSLIWGTGLALFELRLIDYTPLEAEVWMLIGYSWIAFAAGAVTLILARVAVGASLGTHATALPAQYAVWERRFFAIAIMVISSIALATVVQHWLVLLKMFGSIVGILANGYKIYRLRIENQIPGLVPYFDSLALTAAYLAGLYTARTRKIKLLALFPLIVIVLADIAFLGRARMFIAGILFASAYFLAGIKSEPQKQFQSIGKGRRLLMLGLVLTMFLAAAEYVRTFRGAFEGFYGTTKELRQFERSAFLTPSLYLYLSSHPGVFNAYWKAGGEHPFPGSNTFAPVFRILARLGLADNVSYYTKFYNIPISTNTGTYLRELHADFGIAGILAMPYVLGFLCTALWLRIRNQYRLTTIAWLTHLYVIIAFSYFYQATRLGYWAVSLITALAVSSFIDHQCHARVADKKTRQE